MNPTSTMPKDESATESTPSLAADKAWRLSPQDVAEVGDQRAQEAMQELLDKMKRGEPVRER